MASSALSSVIGSPLSDGSSLGFLSFAAGIAAPAGNSTERDKTQAKERMAARNDRGVAEIAGIGRMNGEAGRTCSLMEVSCRIALALRANCSTNRINPRPGRKLRENRKSVESLP